MKEIALTPARLCLQANGAPYSATYDDVYHSAYGGPEQARHVFIAGNGLPQRWQERERFVILETGFGLGLNFLATWASWAADPARCRRLHFISLEKHPFSVSDLAIAQRPWAQFAELAAELQRQWPALLPGTHRLELANGAVTLTLIFGDAAEQLRRIDASVDAFYLDGFSPAKNPELWTPQLFRALARLAAPGATLATWSVAGQVRSGLADNEFEVEKRPGFSGKRQMLVGRYRSRKPLRQPPVSDRRALIIGAGLAGSAVAERLAARGWQVTLLERHAAPGQGASGNIAGVLRPLPSIDDNPTARLTRAGFLTTLKLLARLGENVRWQACGVLQLARDGAHESLQRRSVAQLRPPSNYLQFLEREAASNLLNTAVAIGGWWFPGGGWVQPHSLCRAALAAWPDAITLRYNTPVGRIVRQGQDWQALDAAGHILATAPLLIMASGTEATRFEQFADLPQRPARGQTTHLPAGSLPALKHVVCRQGYVAPAVDGWHALGASFSFDDDDPAERLDDHRDNLNKLQEMLPGLARGFDAAQLHGRVGFRPIAADRLPIVGAMPEFTGLYSALGYGARGLVWCALMAELLVAQLEGDPLPIANNLARAVSPQRIARPN